MRLYKITASQVVGEELPAKTQWVGSKADGVAARKALAIEGYRRKDINEVEVDVPTTKTELLAWLNING